MPVRASTAEAPSEGGDGLRAPADRGSGAIAVATALVLGAALAAAGPRPSAVLAVVALVQIIGVLLVVLFLALPGRAGALTLGAAAVAAVDASLWHWSSKELAPLLPVLALTIPLMFAHQLVRGAARVRLVASLSFIAVLILAVVAMGCWIQLARESTGDGLARGSAMAIAAALVVAGAIDLTGRGPRVDVAAPPTIAGAGAGTVIGAVVGAAALHRAGLDWPSSAGVGAALALLAVLLHLGASFAIGAGGPVRSSRPILRVAAVFALAAPVAYLLCLAAA